MKVNWTAISVFIVILGSVLGYVISIESRFSERQTTENLSDRVGHLETLLTPLLIEYKVAEKLKELCRTNGHDHTPIPESLPPTIAPMPSETELKMQAQEWVDEQFKPKN